MLYGSRFSYVLAVSLASARKVLQSELGYSAKAQLLAIEANATAPSQISGGALSLGVCGRRDFGLLTVAPIIGASALLGERARWVSVSRQRFTRLRLGSEGGSVGVSVQPGERAMVTWATP